MEKKDFDRKCYEFSRLVQAYAFALIERKVDTYDEYHAIMNAYREVLKGDDDDEKKKG